MCADGRLQSAALKQQVVGEASVRVMKLNDFPYHFEEGIVHHCLWSSRALSASEVADQAQAAFPDSATLTFINPPELQSVTTVGA